MLYNSKTFKLLELLDVVGFIVGMFFMGIIYGPKCPFYSCDDILDCLGQVDTGIVFG